jgi:hypothetical protein
MPDQRAQVARDLCHGPGTRWAVYVGSPTPGRPGARTRTRT